MIFKDFEDWLLQEHGKDYGGLDDDSVEAFEGWLEQLDCYEWIELGDKWGKWCYKMGDIRVAE